MKKHLIILFLISLIPLVSLLTPGLPVTHDGQDHIARIANFYQTLSEGTLIPRWAGNLNWGYGHPVMMFLYPLPSYIASAFHAFGFSLVDSVKIVFALAFTASMLAMYLWASAQFGAQAGMLAAILYGFAPYRFVDLYVRGAIGEHVAFVFPPLILWGMLKRNWLVTAVAMAGLILSHNAISLMFLPIIFLYAFYLANNSLRITFSILLGFALTAFFWLPAFIEGKYTLRDIVTAGVFADRFAPAIQLLYTPWNYGGTDTLPKYLGFAQMFAVAAALWALVRAKVAKKKRLLGWGLLMILGGATFLMTRPSLFIWDSVSILQKFQFPWRLLSVSVFAVAALAAWLKPKLWWALAGLAVLLTVPMWKPSSYLVRPESFYTGVYPGTTDTGESSPLWSVRFMEHAPAAQAEVIEGEAQITPVLRASTLHTYTLAASTSSRIRENTLYFPGWQVLVDGSPAEVEFQDPANRGLMTYRVEAGEHEIDVIFGQTKLRKLADAVSLAGLGLLAVFGTMALWKRKT